MAEPTLGAIFGPNATQDGSIITISKSDLATVGLTAAAENTAESLLAAIFLLARDTLTQDSFDANQDQSIVIAPGFDSIVQRDDGTGTLISFRQNQFNLNLHKPDSTAIDPDDY